MPMSGLKGWPGVYVDAWWLGIEASTVIGLRLAKIAVGGVAGSEEARLMVSEKIQAALELQAKLLTDGRQTPLSSSRKALKHYGRVVTANRQRLSR